MNADPFTDYACSKYLPPYLPFHFVKVIYDEEKIIILLWPSVFIFFFRLSAFYNLSPKLWWSSHILTFGSLLWNLFCEWCKVVNQLFSYEYIIPEKIKNPIPSALFIEKSISSFLCHAMFVKIWIHICLGLSLSFLFSSIDLSISHCLTYFCFIINNNMWWEKSFTLLFSSGIS